MNCEFNYKLHLVIMKRYFFILFLVNIFFLDQAYSQTKSQYRPSSKIQSWEKVVIKKDFILSNSLMNHRFCRKVWGYQVPEFKKRNPQVKDVNKFEIGDIVELQLCTDFKFSQTNSNSEKNEIAKSFVPLSEESSISLSDAMPIQDKEIKPAIIISGDDLYSSDFTILGTFGGLSEQNDLVQASFD